MSDLDDIIDFSAPPVEYPPVQEVVAESPETETAGEDDPRAAIAVVRKKGCQGCGESKLLIGFPADDESPDGFADICSLCLAEALEDRRQSEALTLARGVDDKITHSLREAIRDIVPGGGDEFSPHVSTIFESVMRSIGGVQMMGHAWGACFQATKPGSKERRGMLNDLIKLGIKNTEVGRAKQLNELSTDDLKYELISLMKEIKARIPPAVVEVKGGPREQHAISI